MKPPCICQWYISFHLNTLRLKALVLAGVSKRTYYSDLSVEGQYEANKVLSGENPPSIKVFAQKATIPCRNQIRDDGIYDGEYN